MWLNSFSYAVIKQQKKLSTFTTRTTNDLLSKVPSNYIVMTVLFEMEISNENNRSHILSDHQPTERKKTISSAISIIAFSFDGRGIASC
jgi:hypothetical protein